MAFILALVLLAGPLALVFGVDSRTHDDRDRRGWWPGSRRRA